MSFYLKKYFLRVLGKKMRSRVSRADQMGYINALTPEDELLQFSIPSHSRQPPRSRKMIERRALIDSQTDLPCVERDHLSLQR
jgi:hypothetical protein